MHHKGADKAAELYGKISNNVSPYDNISYYEMQENASIGKKDVGVGANGLKVFFTVSNYFNSWIDSGKFLKENLITSNKLFNKTFYINGKEYKVHTISDVKIPGTLINLFKEFGLENVKINEADAALTISGFVSGATDNAKELIMAKLNAIVDLASIHIYLYSMGISAEEVAIYMNSPMVK
jgi:hypothetical protein